MILIIVDQQACGRCQRAGQLPGKFASPRSGDPVGFSECGKAVFVGMQGNKHGMPECTSGSLLRRVMVDAT